MSIAGFVPPAYISRRVVRLLAVWVEEQAVKNATVSKQAAILVIIWFGLGKALAGIPPTVFIITIFPPRMARRIFAKRDAFLRKAVFPR